RPIVGTRSYIASDPMLNEQVDDSVAEKPSGVESTATKEAAAEEPAVNREAKNIKPITEISESKDTASEPDMGALPKTDAVEDTDTKPSAPVEDIPDAAEPKLVKDESAAVPEITEDATSSENEDTADGESSEVEEVPQQTPEDEAAAAREAELERHIAAGTYAVPIGQVKHRRQKMILIFVFVLLLAVVAVDVLLDMDILKLSSVPHTNFL
ncbi:hypothetical protein KDA14_06200, partial [Candidatus Saccharibacteria bacterium]|nr:hypothetical protein [Candidatus Saccharibacteria bacterium]